MFADYNPLVMRHPIYSGKVNEWVDGNTVHSVSIIYECNENILLRYVYAALADYGMLSGKMIKKSEFARPEDPEPEKTFTVQILGDDIGYRFGKRVMFANDGDVKTLLKILVNEVGNDRMHCIHESLESNEPNDVHKVGIKWLAKWKRGDGWPLSCGR